MIDDPELRALFQAENEERIRDIESHLKQLEQDLQNEQAWEVLMRDIHTIKGSARMLKIQTIEVVSHKFEDILDKVHKEQLKITPDLFPLFYTILDAIHSLVNEEVEGLESKVDTVTLLDTLEKTLKTGEKKPKGLAAKKPKEPVVEPGIEAPGVQAPVVKEELKKSKAGKIESAKLHISTIRINIGQINDLMQLVTEISVVRTHMERLFEQIEQILATWEEKKIEIPTFLKFEDKEKAKKRFEIQLENQLVELRSQAYNHINKLQQISASLVKGVRKISLIPISKLFDLFPSMVREIAKNMGKEIDLVITSEDIGVDRKIIEDLKDPLMHLLRNAISHGIEDPAFRQKIGKPPKGKIELKAKQTESSIIIEVEDDGEGLNLQKIKNKAVQLNLVKPEELDLMSEKELQMMIFFPGFSTQENTTDISGRGVGLDVVQATIEDLHGRLQVKSEIGRGTIFSIELPIHFVTTKVMLIRQDGRTYAIPIDLIEICMLITIDQILMIEAQDVVYFKDQSYPVVLLRDLLALTKKEQVMLENKFFSCLIIKGTDRKFALLVDSIIEEQELVVVAIDKMIGEFRGITGATILKNGEVCLVINPAELNRAVNPFLRTSKLAQQSQSKRKRKAILIVDDSPTSRAILKQTLETEDYNITIAEDGIQAIEKLNQETYDAVVTDVDMPRMNGLELTSYIRLHYPNLICVIFTSLASSVDINKGMTAGASAYLVKSEFSQQNIVKLLKEILG